MEEAATLTEDSLKASERSLDSLAATRREGPEGGDGGEPSPRLGLAVSWDLSSAGSFSSVHDLAQFRQHGGLFVVHTSFSLQLHSEKFHKRSVLVLFVHPHPLRRTPHALRAWC